MKPHLLRLFILPILILAGCHIVPSPTPQEELAEQVGVSPDDVHLLPEEKIVRKTKGVIVSIEPSGVPRKNPTQLVTFKNDKTGEERTFEMLAVPEDRKKSLIGQKVYLSNIFDAAKMGHPGKAPIPVFELLFELRR